ncbi:hypothetical protein GC173_08655 [bacterium]|nr:hypothetical protein [bacterium]
MLVRRTVVPSILFAVAMTAAASASLPTLLGYREGQALDVERPIAPGITHRLISRPDGPYTINVATIDLGRGDLVLEAEKGKDDLYSQEPVPAMVDRLYDPAARPLVAINGDFWGARAVPINMFVDEGLIWRLPWSNERGDKGRAIFAFGKDAMRVMVPKFEFVVKPYGSDDPTEVLRIDNLNGDPNGSTVTAYNRAYGHAAPLVPDDRKQIVIQTFAKGPLPNAEVTGTVLSTDMRTGVTLDDTTVVLQMKGDAPEWLAAGSDIVLAAKMDGIDGPVEGVIGGGPTLLRNGEVVAESATEEEGFGKSGISDKHPRTALGIKADGKTLVLVVVDGRQPRRSVGMSFPELAAVMKEMGCVDAMNLDGGGSSTMVVGGELANFPSDSGGPRSVSNALIVRRTAPLGPAAAFAAIPAHPVVPVGGALPVALEALDESGEQVALDGWKVALAKSPRKAVPIGEFRLSVEKAGAQSIALKLTGPNGEQKDMTIAADGVKPTAVQGKPVALLMAKGDEAQIRYDFASASTTPFSAGVQPGEFKLPKFLAWDEFGTSVKAIAPGAGYIVAKTGKHSVRIPVAVDTFASTTVDAMDAPPAFVYTHAKTTSPSEAPTVETTTVRQGSGAWKVEYKMIRGGTSKIALPVKADLPGVPLGVGLWVYGDGNEHWLRGILSDADGDRYYLDFTTGLGGVDWKDEWKFLTASLATPTVLRASKPTPKAPLRLDEIYLVQPQEAAKKDGTLLLDDLCVLGLPKMK